MVYKIGEKLIWGGNDVGKPNLKAINVYGYAADNVCPHCDKLFEEEEFDIRLEHDVFMSISVMKDYKKYLANGDDEYYEVNN